MRAAASPVVGLVASLVVLLVPPGGGLPETGTSGWTGDARATR